MREKDMTKLRKKTLILSLKKMSEYLVSVTGALEAQDETTSFSHLDTRRLIQSCLADVLEDSAAYDVAVVLQIKREEEVDEK